MAEIGHFLEAYVHSLSDVASRHILNDIIPKQHAYTYEVFVGASFAVRDPGHPTVPPTGD